ncbi:hypothetical protein ACWCQN_40990 [Streptomyces sp. NPDC001984]
MGHGVSIRCGGARRRAERWRAGSDLRRKQPGWSSRDERPKGLSQRQFDVESAWHGTPFIVNKTIRSTCRGNRQQRPWEPDTEATIQAAAAADVGNDDQPEPEPEPQATADEPAPAPQARADELAAKRIRRPKVDSAAADKPKPKPRPARKCTAAKPAAAKPAAAKAADAEPKPRRSRGSW